MTNKRRRDRGRKSSARRSGLVTEFDDAKGSGLIAADDGEVVWFHQSEIVMDGYPEVTVGERVTFIWNGGSVENGRHVGVAVLRDGDKRR